MTEINLYIEKIREAILPKKRDREKIQVTPYRDWRIIVITFFFAVALLSGGTLYVSHSLDKKTTEPGAQNALLPVETIDRNSMLKTIEAFDEKGFRLAELLSKKPKKTDPSL